MLTSQRRQFLKTVAGVSTAGVSILAGCLSSGPIKETGSVEITEDGFSPKNVHIDQQDSLMWVNEDDTVHTVTSATEDWDFDTELEPGFTVQNTFNFDGVYEIVCTKHGSKEEFTGERMKLSVGSEEIEDPIE